MTMIGGSDQVYVFRYGSDPLKTYLPDSDIDITIIRKETLYGDSSQPQFTNIYILRL